MSQTNFFVTLNSALPAVMHSALLPPVAGLSGRRFWCPLCFYSGTDIEFIRTCSNPGAGYYKRDSKSIFWGLDTKIDKFAFFGACGGPKIDFSD